MRLCSLIILIVLMLGARSSFAQSYWSVGPKLGYTFGADGGVTIGAEATYFPPESFVTGLPYGFTFDLTHWKGHLNFHAGIETWFLIGVDVGPTLFFDDIGANLGMSLIGWDGYFLYPYYEMGIPFNGEIYHSVGGYLKFPLGLRYATPAWVPVGPVG